MTAITSVASGLWSDAGTWGGTLPTSGDDVTIATGHIITLDTMTAACSTLTANGTAQLVASKTASSQLAIALTSTFAGTSALDIDVSDISTVPTLACTIIHSAGGSAANNGCSIGVSADIRLKGAFRKRVTKTQSALLQGVTGSVVVDDATGWKINDDIVFATTQAYNAVPRVDCVTITGISGGPLNATVAWSAATLLYAHDTRCYVGNLSSNLVWKPQNSGGVAYLVASTGAAYSQRYARQIRDVQFFQQGGTYQWYSLYINGAYATGQPWVGGGVFNNAWHKTTVTCMTAFQINNSYYAVPRSDNTVYAVANGAASWGGTSSGAYGGSAGDIGDETNLTVFRGGTVVAPPGRSLINPIISGAAGIIPSSGTVVGGELWSSYSQSLVTCYSGYSLQMTGTKLNASYMAVSSQYIFNTPANSAITLTDCVIANFTIGTTLIGFNSWPTNYVPTGCIWLNNLGGDPTVQALYASHSLAVPIKYRDNASGKSSASSLRMMTNKTLTASADWTVTHTQTIPSQSGVPVRVVGYMKFDRLCTGSVPPATSVTISGKGITPVTVAATAAGLNAWEKFDISVTQTSGTAGNLTMTYSHGISDNTQTYAWFSGVPDSPWIDTCRHYGFVEDATNKLRVVDPIIVLSEAAAGALSGLSITGTGPTLALNVTGTRSLSEIYDWVHAYLAANLTQPSFLTSSDGVNFNCAFHLNVSGAITGAGAISMPTKTLTLTGTIAPNVTDITGSYAHLTLTGLIIGSDVVVLAPGTSTEKTMVDAIGTTTFSWAYATAAVSSVDVCIYKPGFLPYIVRNLALTAAGVSLPVAQLTDRNYV